MEALDKNGDLIAWLSDDPDDFNSHSDYESKLQRMILDINEELFCVGDCLLGYDTNNPLEYIKLLGSINPEFTSNPNLQKKLLEIKTWSNYRLTSNHPDELDKPRLSQDAQKAEEYFDKARTCWNSSRV